jgi:hypothetical protein
MDGARGALLPVATGFRLKADVARWGEVLRREEVGEVLAEALGWSLALGRGGLSGLSNDEIQPETRSQELVELSTMSYWSTTQSLIQPPHNVRMSHFSFE